jgi:hypothetical protein
LQFQPYIYWQLKMNLIANESAMVVVYRATKLAIMGANKFATTLSVIRVIYILEPLADYLIRGVEQTPAIV